MTNELSVINSNPIEEKLGKIIEAQMRLGVGLAEIQGVTIDKVTKHLDETLSPTESRALIDSWYVARLAMLCSQMYTNDKTEQFAVKQEIESLEKMAEKFGEKANIRIKQATKGKSVSITRVKI